MNNLSSYCGLVDAKIRASDKDLPVPMTFPVTPTYLALPTQLKNDPSSQKERPQIEDNGMDVGHEKPILLRDYWLVKEN